MSSPFSPQETERYARHFVLPEIGGPGQQKLKSARVVVIGAGGLGAPALQYLAAAGIGQLTIVDDDVVSLSNLQRQIIHHTNSVGEPKVTSAANTLASINPHVKVDTKQIRIDPKNAAGLIHGHTLALDGSDNFQTRYLMADACAAAEIPLITAAVSRFDGSITTLKPWINSNPGYRDLFPNQPKEGLLPSCAEAGVMGAITGLMGTLQALEAIKEITGAGEGLVGKLLMVDGLHLRFETIGYARRSG
ncbi:MAG: molybdopterin-synthase adenylyltransferase MoeB [Rhizobiaceae bacterium]|nr:molybdopterin-synthase adenylyltransferase MoeB [Rhizobiaceae bacterium]